MSVKKQGITPENFYGEKNPREEEIEALLLKNDFSKNSELFQQPLFMNRLLGPSRTWKIFKKQKDAIDCCLLRQNGLMPFAFEDINGRRMFLAAHPKVFWALNCNRFFKNCNSYEIIREYSACKLYLDIEFEYIYNQNKNGERMLNNVLSIIDCNLKDVFSITCTKNEALDLDSSSNTKFSHHVIYEIKNLAFQNNYAVGNFVKKICNELKDAFERNLTGDNNKLEKVAEKYNLQANDILDLFVLDHKGKPKLLIDDGVYTKNRHFRLLGSSKQSKRIPLKISKNNKYIIINSDPLEYFLDSLVTYFSWEIKRLLEFGRPDFIRPFLCKKQIKLDVEKKESGLYPKIDAFIDSLISPSGRIRKKVFFSESFTMVYDIQGFRYCHNVKREHRSNNIKYIVDLKNKTFYQKCHDPDCADFRSDLWKLPNEICVFFEKDSLISTDVEHYSEKDFIKVLEQIECENNFEPSITDEDLGEIVDSVETMVGFDWITKYAEETF